MTIDFYRPSSGSPFVYFSRHCGGFKLGLLWAQFIVNW